MEASLQSAQLSAKLESRLHTHQAHVHPRIRRSHTFSTRKSLEINESLSECLIHRGGVLRLIWRLWARTEWQVGPELRAVLTISSLHVSRPANIRNKNSKVNTFQEIIIHICLLCPIYHFPCDRTIYLRSGCNNQLSFPDLRHPNTPN